jgi:hypothetical protein
MASGIGCNSLWESEIAGTANIFSELVNEKVAFKTHFSGLLAWVTRGNTFRTGVAR